MREIKFRAYCQVCDNFVRVYDSLTQFKDGITNQCPNHEVRTDTQLMQYTGLKDKNGVEIYEGDVVKHGNGIQQVYYDNTTASYQMNLKGSVYDQEYGGYDNVEVIGNIYQNPELLRDTRT